MPHFQAGLKSLNSNATVVTASITVIQPFLSLMRAVHLVRIFFQTEVTMNRSNPIKNTFNRANRITLRRKTAVHEAGHAAAIYLGNKQKQLPPVFFRIFINEPGSTVSSFDYSSETTINGIGKIEGGRLIHTLPSSVAEATRDFPLEQKQAYCRAFEADIINLLVGPLAEANYVALSEGEGVNPYPARLQGLPDYGGISDLEMINEYLGCFNLTERAHKISVLYAAAWTFISNTSNWLAICALADYILTGTKYRIECEEAIAVLDERLDGNKE
jgi:hypothetical protein